MRRGSLPIRKVGVIVLGILTVATIYAATSGWFDTIMGDFLGNLEYQQ